jgi:hypothetical protein
MVRKPGQTEGEKDTDPGINGPIARQERGGALGGEPDEVLFAGHDRLQEDPPAVPLLANRPEIEDGRAGLLLERGREILFEDGVGARRVLDRQAHRREVFQEPGVLRVESRAREGLEDLVGRARVDLDVDPVRGRWGRVVGGPRARGRRGLARRRGGARGGKGEDQESRRCLHPRMASIAASTSAKLSSSASGCASASRAAGVGPVATATARTPSGRPHRTSCTESPTMTKDLPK